MIPDPAIDEIRRIRHDISREAGHDLRQMKSLFSALESQFSRPPLVLDRERTRHLCPTEVAPTGHPISERGSPG